MPKQANNRVQYLSISERDEQWGIVVTTVGSQRIEPAESYPPQNHPDQYIFKPQNGRILNEYQMVYIVSGSGYFESTSISRCEIKAGTLLLIFPNEWHSYYPDTTTGWEEYWVGFRGEYIDRRVDNEFFAKNKAIYNIGINSMIVDMYANIIHYAKSERVGYQQLVSSFILNIMGLIFYQEKNINLTNTNAINKIDQAREIMQKNASSPIPLEMIAQQLGISYTWFRRMFKRQTGVSPAQYQAQKQILLAKDLLTNTVLNINEIAYALNFENGSQFATFFKRHTDTTPTHFRDKTRPYIKEEV